MFFSLLLKDIISGGNPLTVTIKKVDGASTVLGGAEGNLFISDNIASSGITIEANGHAGVENVLEQLNLVQVSDKDEKVTITSKGDGPPAIANGYKLKVSNEEADVDVIVLTADADTKTIDLSNTKKLYIYNPLEFDYDISAADNNANVLLYNPTNGDQIMKAEAPETAHNLPYTLPKTTGSLILSTSTASVTLTLGKKTENEGVRKALTGEKLTGKIFKHNIKKVRYISNTDDKEIEQAGYAQIVTTLTKQVTTATVENADGKDLFVANDLLNPTIVISQGGKESDGKVLQKTVKAVVASKGTEKATITPQSTAETPAVTPIGYLFNLKNVLAPKVDVYIAQDAKMVENIKVSNSKPFFIYNQNYQEKVMKITITKGATGIKVSDITGEATDLTLKVSDGTADKEVQHKGGAILTTGDADAEIKITFTDAEDKVSNLVNIKFEYPFPEKTDKVQYSIDGKTLEQLDETFYQSKELKPTFTVVNKGDDIAVGGEEVNKKFFIALNIKNPTLTVKQGAETGKSKTLTGELIAIHSSTKKEVIQVTLPTETKNALTQQEVAEPKVPIGYFLNIEGAEKDCDVFLAYQDINPLDITKEQPLIIKNMGGALKVKVVETNPPATFTIIKDGKVINDKTLSVGHDLDVAAEEVYVLRASENAKVQIVFTAPPGERKSLGAPAAGTQEKPKNIHVLRKLTDPASFTYQLNDGNGPIDGKELYPSESGSEGEGEGEKPAEKSSEESESESESESETVQSEEGSDSGSNQDTDESSGLGPGAIAGIVIGCVAGVAIIAGLIFFFVSRKKKVATVDP